MRVEKVFIPLLDDYYDYIYYKYEVMVKADSLIDKFIIEECYIDMAISKGIDAFLNRYRKYKLSDISIVTARLIS